MEERLAQYCLSKEERQRTLAFLEGCRVPVALERAVEAYIAKKTGREYGDPVILERLRRAVIAQKDDYWKAPQRRRLSYTKGYSVLGYLAYHFPVYFMQAEYLLLDLADAGLLKPRITVLDAGTGPGVVPLAIADFFSRLDSAAATIWSIEQSEEHIEAFRFLAGSIVHLTKKVAIRPPIRADLKKTGTREIPGPIDLLVFSNVINEFERDTVSSQADIVMKFADRLAPDGTVLIMEPAEEVTALRLRILARALQDRGLTIHSPCTFPWGTRCDPGRCWSFASQPDIRPTRLMEALAGDRDPYRYLNTDIKYAHVVLRKDAAVLNRYRIPPHAKLARLSKLHLHVNRKINAAGVKMSLDLGDAKTHLYKVCDGTVAKPVFAVLPWHNTARSNETILEAPYGTLLELGNVLVRYNKKYDAYNLLIGRDSAIRVLASPARNG